MQTSHIDNDGVEITNINYPDYNALTKAERRSLLLPLVEQIRLFYNSAENRTAFEKWKAERQTKALAT